MKVSKLIYDNTKNSSDLFYRTSFKAPDPILFIEFRNKKYLILNDLEIERGKSEAKVDSVLPLSSISRKIKSNSIEQVILHLLKEFKIKTIEVPYNFPSYIYKKLTKSKIKVMPSKSPIFFNSRIVKNQTEIKSISKVMRHTEKVMRLIIEKIKYSKSKNKILRTDGRILTSELLRNICQKELSSYGLECPDCIISSGRHSSLPHHQGTGPIKECQSIIIDIFPKDTSSGYFGDMTRTVVKGTPSKKLNDMYKAVLKGQRLGLSLIKSGVKSKTVHNSIKSLFDSSGFYTTYKEGTPEGFIHSTGHGLGLDIHEPPRISSGDDILKKNYVVTVEPGLYYSHIGGVRVEDTVLVTTDGCKNLTRFPKNLNL